MPFIENQFSIDLFYYFLKANWYIATISICYLVYHRPDFRATIVLFLLHSARLNSGLVRRNKQTTRASRQNSHLFKMIKTGQRSYER